jgi:hypothetical protein
MTELGIPEYEAKQFESRFRKGASLLSVHCDDRERVKTTQEILAQTGTGDVFATTRRKQISPPAIGDVPHDCDEGIVRDSWGPRLRLGLANVQADRFDHRGQRDLLRRRHQTSMFSRPIARPTDGTEWPRTYGAFSLPSLTLRCHAPGLERTLW